MDNTNTHEVKTAIHPDYTTMECYSDGRVKNIRWNKFIDLPPNNNGRIVIKFRWKKKMVSVTRYRMIMEAFSGKNDDMVIDHINGIKTDDRLDNLRYCTQGDNLRNRNKFKNASSAYYGVMVQKSNLNKFTAYFVKDKKTHIIGYYDDEVDAAKAYDKTIKEQGLETFNRLNF